MAGSVGFDESCRKEAKNLAPKYGISVVDDQTYAQTDTHMTPHLTNLRSHADIQAVLDCGSQAPTAITTRNYQQLGMSKIPLYLSHALPSAAYLDGPLATPDGRPLPAPAAPN